MFALFRSVIRYKTWVWTNIFVQTIDDTMKFSIHLVQRERTQKGEAAMDV